MDVLTLDPDLAEAEDLAYHPKVEERLAWTLKEEQKKLETCAAEQLPEIQAMIRALRFVLLLPKKILEDQMKEAARQREVDRYDTYAARFTRFNSRTGQETPL